MGFAAGGGIGRSLVHIALLYISRLYIMPLYPYPDNIDLTKQGVVSRRIPETNDQPASLADLPLGNPR